MPRSLFLPPVPDPTNQGLAARSSDKHARPSVRAKSEPKTPRKTEETPSKRSEGNLPMQTPQIAVESSKSLVAAVTDASAVKSEANVQGVSNGPQSAGNVSDRAQRIIPPSTASMSQAVISPTQPLFDEQQLRQFQEMFNQAPWLYPGAQQLMMSNQFTMPPPIARPLFLEQDERRVQGSLQVGEALQFAFPYGQREGQNPRPQEIPFQSRSDLKTLMEENKQLQERVLAVESQKKEEPQFSTPNGEQKEAETTTKEAARPPQTEAEETRNFRSKEAETTKEAAGPQRPKNHGTASFTEKSLEFMSLMVHSLGEMQKRMQELGDDMGIVEGSLEVKLPTIWTDEKQSRAEAERRERLEERRSEEKESEERRCRCAKR